MKTAFRRRRHANAESGGHRDEVGERVRLHLAHGLTPVCLDRDFADAEFAATCLFNRPETTSAMTSRSRGVSDA